MTSAKYTLLKDSNNLIYQIDFQNKHYILRIHKPGSRKLEWINSELMWLRAISRDTDLRVPEPLAPAFTTQTDGYSIHCTLLRWLDGEQVLPGNTTVKQAQRIGAFTAKLHDHSSSYITPAEFSLPRLKWEEMFGNTAIYTTTESDALFTEEQKTVLRSIGLRVRDTMGKLQNETGTFGVIHADLIWKNILFNVNELGAIDFDDCSYGFYLYDLAPILLGYMDEANYTEIRAAIWDGYTSIRPQPESFQSHLETLITGRYALSCLWIAANQNSPAIAGRATEITAHRIGELRRYLDSGVFRRGEIII
jgi:Ser/Thr protein kinase RdoA (MazF antagonist)